LAQTNKVLTSKLLSLGQAHRLAMQEVQELDFRSQEQRQLDEVHKAEAKLRNTEVCGNVANHVF